jgi:hypothetical protein
MPSSLSFSSFTVIIVSCRALVSRVPQNSHTYQNRNITAAKNPNHTLHPTPVLSAILSIRFIVPLSCSRLFSNESFIVSASFEESRISSPMRCVSYRTTSTSVRTEPRATRYTYVLQHLHLPRQNPHLLIILALQLIQHCTTVLPLRIRCRASEAWSPSCPKSTSYW